ncbi:MAG TPA: T9SS type A sorting domain-containing protein [Bacteroidetes bacterium]|nr:T9SS type A sorting domain-containing protein [Bacteroidota bacterium]
MKSNFKIRTAHQIKGVRLERLMLIFSFCMLTSVWLNGQTCYCDEATSLKVGTAVGIPTLSQAIASTPLPSGTIATGFNFCIDGDFLIDVTYFFEDSEINISPDSKVTVGVGSTLGFTNSNVYGCNEMWNSIYLAGVPYGWPNAGIHVINSTIRDAEVAIDIGVYNDLYLEGSIFEANHIGVRATSGDGGVPNVLKFEGISFITGDSPLPPHANEIMYAGVYLERVYGFTIGTGTAAVAFLRIKNGIVSKSSSFIANRCGFFTSLAGFPTVANISEDQWNGILMYDSRALVTESAFDNNTVGVHAINSSIELINNTLPETIGYGLYVNGNQNGWVTVKDNLFVCFKSAVYLSNLQNTLVDIENNTIEIKEENDGDLPNEDGLAGILIEGCNFYSFANGFFNRRAMLSNNTIDLKDAPFGVSLVASTGVDVLGSVATPITFLPNNGDFDSSPDLLAGINIQGGGDHIVSGNSIIGEGATVTLPGSNDLITGVRASMSDFNSFCDNTMDGLEVGVRFEGPNMGAEFLGTNFNGHDVALSMDADGVIGLQVGAGNQWNLAALDKGARHENPDPFFSQFSQFRVDAYGLPTTPVYPTGIDPDPSTTTADWFFNDGSTSGDCTLGFGPGEDPTSVDEAIAGGTVISGTSFSNTTKWQLERYLFSKLDRYPAIVQQHPGMASFYNANQNATLGKLHAVQKNITGLGGLPANEVGQYEGNIDSLFSNLSRLVEIYTALTTATPAKKAQLMAERQGIVQNMKTWENANDSLLVLIESHRAGLVQQYTAQNAAILTTAGYEANEQTVNDIYLNTVAQGLYSFTSSQRNSLDAIATQCPKMGGSAVYGARALYQLVDKIHYNDRAVCYPPNNPLLHNTGQAGQATMATASVSLYPNPAKGEVSLMLGEGILADRVEIVNLNGQVMAVRDFADGGRYVNMSIAGIPAGIYFVEIKDGKKTVQTEKLVIQR